MINQRKFLPRLNLAGLKTYTETTDYENVVLSDAKVRQLLGGMSFVQPEAKNLLQALFILSEIDPVLESRLLQIRKILEQHISILDSRLPMIRNKDTQELVAEYQKFLGDKSCQ